MVFPFDFGFLPGTRGQDGDPLDVLVLMDAPVYPGIVVEARVIGLLRCKQRETGQQEVRNDRFLAVAEEASTYRTVREIRDVEGALLDQIEAFFVDYNRLAGRAFRVVSRHGPTAARRSIEAARL
jgi:inorganic pyrophosphatase